MIIGIDASRANVKEKTGTEWYAYHVIEEIKRQADPRDQFILYSKEPLVGQLADLPNNFSSKVLRWPPELLWTQLRLAGEMLWHTPGALFVPAHTIPLIRPKKTIVTLHDVGFERFAELYSQQRIGSKNKLLSQLLAAIIRIITGGRYGNTELDYHRWSARLALRGARKIVTVSEFSKSEIVKLFRVSPERIAVTPLAAHPAYSFPKNQSKVAQVLKKYNITYPFFLSIGRLEEKKNTAGTVEGFGRFKGKHANQYKLVLIGKPGFGFEKVQAALRRWNIENEVVMLGWVSTADLPCLMAAAEIFVFPSFYEGFGLPVLEAMKSGTPVITSKTGATREVADGAAQLVDPHSPEEIAQAMAAITTDERLHQRLREQGRQRAALFSWEKTGRQTLALIKNL